MKAVIPVAGAGTRLRPHTYTQPKPLIPVAGKPIIAFIVDKLLEVGVTDFVFIIGYLGEKIENYLHQAYPNLNKEFVVQNERMGLGHAIWTARNSLVGTDEIFIILGDIIFDADLSKMISNPLSCLGVKNVDDPREFGVVELGEDNLVKKVVEKPRIPKSDLAIVGLYKIKEVSTLIDCIENNIQNDVRTMGEFQLTDGLMCMIEKGVQFSSYTVNNWFDCGRKGILLETNSMLLDKMDQKTPAQSFANTIIIPPVSIGENCEISNSILGPHVTIGDNATIKSSIVKDSIIGNYATIDEVMLHHSVIGSDTSIKGLKQSLNIGDNTEIDFS